MTRPLLAELTPSLAPPSLSCLLLIPPCSPRKTYDAIISGTMDLLRNATIDARAGVTGMWGWV